MERLPVTGATLTATSALGVGKVVEDAGNNQGVWVVGNARDAGSFSATVRLFTSVSNVAGACAYASNYPPVGMYIFASEISFTGTPDYKVILERYDKSTYTVTVNKNESLLIPNDEAALSFTDKTGAQGVILRGIFQPQGSCTYTEPAVVGTFASFPSTYSGATYVSLMDARDGKVYPVVKVGNRWMMARNLNYQKDLTWQANSSQPSNVIGQDLKLIGNFWCPGIIISTSSSSLTCGVYGALYSWETAMVLDGVGTWVTTDDHYNASVASGGTYNHGRAIANGTAGSGRGICPEHWHVPTDAEWGVFFDAVEGGGSTAHQNASGNDWFGANAGKLSKAACTGTATDAAALWSDNANRGTDTYGFRGLPAGNRAHNGANFNGRGNYVNFWSSSASSSSLAWHRSFHYDRADVEHLASNRSFGLPVRCIRDL
jgi:uncharacterized protein (TIGR02145 family)